MPDFYQPFLSSCPEPEGPWTYVYAVMLFPSGDLGAHVSTMIAMLSRTIDFEASALDTSLESALWAARFLRDAPRLDEKAHRRGARRGVVARTVLETVLRAAEHGYPEFASVGAVLRFLSRELQRRGISGTKLESLERHWREHQSVAHLWAAMDEATSLELGEEALLEFLARAEALRRRGEVHKPPRRGDETLLDPRTTWKVPDGVPLPAVTVSLPPLSDEELRLLKTSTG